MKRTDMYRDIKRMNSRDIERVILHYELELLANRHAGKRVSLKTTIKGLRALREITLGSKLDVIANDFHVTPGHFEALIASAKRRVDLILKIKQKQTKGVSA